MTVRNQIARAEPSRGAPSWSKTMAEVQPCGHTNAQHLYHDSGDIKIDLSACLVNNHKGHAGQNSGGATAGAPTASAAPEPSRGALDAAHTPGPWIACGVMVMEDHGIAIAECLDRGSETPSPLANARLIAQAPTLLAENEKLRAGHVVLLEALRSTMQSLDDWLCDDTISDETQSEMLTLEDEILKLLRKFGAEAEIKQVERT